MAAERYAYEALAVSNEKQSDSCEINGAGELWLCLAASGACLCGGFWFCLRHR